MNDWLGYIVVVGIYVARITTVTAAILATGPLWAALKTCWKSRHLPLTGIVSALRPFDITLLFRGILSCCIGAIFGGIAFTALDTAYIPTRVQWAADLSVVVVWSLWAFGITSTAAAFACRPRAMYRGILVFVVGSMVLAAWSGRLG